MIEIVLLFAISSMVLVAGLVLVNKTGPGKRRKQGFAVIAVAIVMLASSGVFSILEMNRELDAAFGDVFTNDGSAAALYSSQAIIPADNGSLFIVWSSNAGRHYTSQNQRADNQGGLHLAKVDSLGKIVFDKIVDTKINPRDNQYLARSRFQDGYLFLNTEHLRVFDAGGNATAYPPSTWWCGRNIFSLPSGPLTFPWDKAPIEGRIVNNALADSSGNITFLSKSLYPGPLSGIPNHTETGLFCSVIDGNGTLLVNQTPLPGISGWLRFPVPSGMDLDSSGRLMVAGVAAPDWQQDNATHFVLNEFDANFTLGTNVTLDQTGDYFESLKLLGVQCPEEGHFRMLLSRVYIEGRGTSKEKYVVRFDLADMTFPDGQPPCLRISTLAAIPSSSRPSGDLSPDGKTVSLVYQIKGELWLRSLDLSGHPRFKDVRLTPTNDSYSWDYQYQWG
jgi:hypothetical protein